MYMDTGEVKFAMALDLKMSYYLYAGKRTYIKETIMGLGGHVVGLLYIVILYIVKMK